MDQLWDSSIHNYKLTETAEDADADEYDQYVFTVRRKFDWENKYTETVVDIKSKPLKEALTHVMGAVKGIIFPILLSICHAKPLKRYKLCGGYPNNRSQHALFISRRNAITHERAQVLE